MLFVFISKYQEAQKQNLAFFDEKFQNNIESLYCNFLQEHSLGANPRQIVSQIIPTASKDGENDDFKNDDVDNDDENNYMKVVNDQSLSTNERYILFLLLQCWHNLTNVCVVQIAKFSSIVIKTAYETIRKKCNVFSRTIETFIYTECGTFIPLIDLNKTVTCPDN